MPQGDLLWHGGTGIRKLALCSWLCLGCCESFRELWAQGTQSHPYSAGRTARAQAQVPLCSWEPSTWSRAECESLNPVASSSLYLKGFKGGKVKKISPMVPEQSPWLFSGRKFGNENSFKGLLISFHMHDLSLLCVILLYTTFDLIMEWWAVISSS